jgi:hypothetical protein
VLGNSDNLHTATSHLLRQAGDLGEVRVSVFEAGFTMRSHAVTSRSVAGSVSPFTACYPNATATYPSSIRFSISGKWRVYDRGATQRITIDKAAGCGELSDADDTVVQLESSGDAVSRESSIVVTGVARNTVSSGYRNDPTIAQAE